MKNLWIPLLLITLFWMACGKDPVSSVTPIVTNPADSTDTTAKPDTSYIVSGLTDITIGPYKEKANLNMGVGYVSGAQEKVTFSLSGLPEGVEAAFTPAASGIPPFTTAINFSSSYAKQGSYPIKITGKSAAGKEKSYTISLKVDGYTPPCEQVIGSSALVSLTTTLPGSSDIICTHTLNLGGQLMYVYLGTIGTDTVLSHSPTGNMSQEIAYAANCEARTITIPMQLTTVSTSQGLKSYTISGAGTIDFTGKKVTINYTVVDFNSQSASYVMTGDLYL